MSDGTTIPLQTSKTTLTLVTCLPFRSFMWSGSEGGRHAHRQVSALVLHSFSDEGIHPHRHVCRHQLGPSCSLDKRVISGIIEKYGEVLRSAAPRTTALISGGYHEEAICSGRRSRARFRGTGTCESGVQRPLFVRDAWLRPRTCSQHGVAASAASSVRAAAIPQPARVLPAAAVLSPGT